MGKSTTTSKPSAAAAAAAAATSSRMAPTGDVIPLKTAKKSTKHTLPRVIYVGHVPHGFYEAQMREYFGQFGDVTRVKVSRNKKTGKSKHYAFVEFKHPEVAAIVAESMNNYLLANQVLQVVLVPPEKVHEKTFEGTGTKFKVVPWQRRAAAAHNKERTESEQVKRNKGLVKAEDKRRAKIAAAGIDYDFPGYKSILKTEAPKTPKTKAAAGTTKTKNTKTPAKKEAVEEVKAEKKVAKAKTPATKKAPAAKEEPTSGKKPTPVAKKTRGALKRAQETPAKPAKKAKK